MQYCLLLSSKLQQQRQKRSKANKEPQSDLGSAVQDTARPPDELIGVTLKLGGEKDQIVLVKEEQQADLKPEWYVPLVMSSPLTFGFTVVSMHCTHV